VSPVNRFENRELQSPGPVTGQIMELMEKIMHFKDDRFNDWFQPLA